MRFTLKTMIVVVLACAVTTAAGCKPRINPAILEDDPKLTAEQRDVKKMMIAFYSGDTDTVWEMTHPNVQQNIGDKSALIAAVRLTSGMRVEWLKFPDEPTFYEGTENEYVVVPTKIRLVKGRKKVDSQNCQVGIRKKGETTWRYCDGRPGEARVRSVFPDLPQDVRFPTRFSSLAPQIN